jgi:pimeloyl-ACP methyl ester carboxylesterase
MNIASPHRTISHKLCGSGPQKVIVMHDWFGDSTNYDSVLEYLDLKNFTYVFADLRGYGRSRYFQGECTVEEGANDIAVLVKQLKWNEFSIISHSMSALIAQYLASPAYHSGNGQDLAIKKIVAITPVPACGSPAPEEALKFLEDAAINNQTSARQVIQFMTSYQQPSTFVDKKVQQWYETSDPQARIAYLKMFSQTNFVQQVQGVETPFLVITGANDAEAYRESVMKETFIKWYPYVQLKVLQGCGHFPMQEQPAQLAEVFQSFLKE